MCKKTLCSQHFQINRENWLSDNHGIIIGTLNQVILGIEEDVNYLSRFYNNIIKHKEKQTNFSFVLLLCSPKSTWFNELCM